MEGRPNIVLLVGEDTGRHQGCYGDPVARTPNIDRLAAEGVRFTNAFTHTPVCAPSRSGLVTGRYPTTLGSHHHRSRLRRPPRLFMHELRSAGYSVAWPAKTDFNFPMPPEAADTTADWIEGGLGAIKGRPFFAYFNFEMTHESAMWGQERYLQNISSVPPEERTDPAAVSVPAYLPDRPAVREAIARYYDMLAVQDRQIGRALEVLEQSGELDRTLIIYLSDHGRGLPREKRWCYDAGVHLPLIIRAPGLVEAGTVREDLVGWVDIAPQILCLADVPIPRSYQGRAFLNAGEGEFRRYVYGGRDRMDETFDQVRFVRNRRYHYLRNYYPALPYAQRNDYMEKMPVMQLLRRMRAEGELTGSAAAFMAERKPAEALYDSQADPDMVHNLADSPAHAAILQQMRDEMNRWIEETGDLGRYSEKELVDRGIVEDVLEEYRSWVKPLPPDWRIGPERPVMTREETEAWQKDGDVKA